MHHLDRFGRRAAPKGTGALDEGARAPDFLSRRRVTAMDPRMTPDFEDEEEEYDHSYPAGYAMGPAPPAPPIPHMYGDEYRWRMPQARPTKGWNWNGKPSGPGYPGGYGVPGGTQQLEARVGMLEQLLAAQNRVTDALLLAQKSMQASAAAASADLKKKVKAQGESESEESLEEEEEEEDEPAHGDVRVVRLFGGGSRLSAV